MSAQPMTGSPARNPEGSGPGFKEPRSWNVWPWSVDKATPLTLSPLMPASRLPKVSMTLPDSLKPTTTLLPHQAVEVSLWVNPVTREDRKSVLGSTQGSFPNGCWGASDSPSTRPRSPRGSLPQVGAVAAPVFRQVNQVLRVSRECLALSRGHLRGGCPDGIHPGFEVIQPLIGGLTPCRRGYEQSEKTSGSPKLPKVVGIHMRSIGYFEWNVRNTRSIDMPDGLSGLTTGLSASSLPSKGGGSHGLYRNSSAETRPRDDLRLITEQFAGLFAACRHELGM